MNTATILGGGGRLGELDDLEVGLQGADPEHQVKDHTAAAVAQLLLPAPDGQHEPGTWEAGGASSTAPPVPGLPQGGAALPRLLMPDEERELADCIEIIERGLDTFVEVGLALAKVRDRRLYRVSHDTFEGWCGDHYGWTSRHARRLIEAADVVRNLQLPGENGTPGSVFVVPAAEKHVRPLLRLPPEEQRGAWDEALRTAPNGRVTAAHVEGVVSAWRVKLGLQEPARAPVKSAAAAGPVVDVQPVPNKQQRLRELADDAIAAVRELAMLLSTPDSRQTGLTPIVDRLQELKDHLVSVEWMQAARTNGVRKL